MSFSVIVEEAAFAPEAHIVVALPSSCQHLIMMGKDMI